MLLTGIPRDLGIPLVPGYRTSPPYRRSPITPFAVAT